MKAVLQVGDRWAKMECIAIINKEHVWYDGSFQSSAMRDFYIFQCDCGSKPVEVMVAIWKGKRSTPDCGCGISNSDEGKKAVMVAMPVSMARQVELISRNSGGVSQWVRDCIQAGLDGRIFKP